MQKRVDGTIVNNSDEQYNRYMAMRKSVTRSKTIEETVAHLQDQVDRLEATINRLIRDQQ